MATLKVYNGSSWDVAVAKTWDGSAWEDQMKFHDGTSWVELYPALAVSLATAGVVRSTIGDCYAGVQYNSTGLEYESPPGGGTGFSISRGYWLDGGSNSEVWIERIINSGSLYSDSGSGRLALTSSRAFQVRDTSTSGGPVTCNLTINAYDAASGGNLLDSVTFTLSANKESPE